MHDAYVQPKRVPLCGGLSQNSSSFPRDWVSRSGQCQPGEVGVAEGFGGPYASTAGSTVKKTAKRANAKRILSIRSDFF